MSLTLNFSSNFTLHSALPCAAWTHHASTIFTATVSHRNTPGQFKFHNGWLTPQRPLTTSPASRFVSQWIRTILYPDLPYVLHYCRSNSSAAISCIFYSSGLLTHVTQCDHLHGLFDSRQQLIPHYERCRRAMTWGEGNVFVYRARPMFTIMHFLAAVIPVHLRLMVLSWLLSFTNFMNEY